MPTARKSVLLPALVGGVILLLIGLVAVMLSSRSAPVDRRAEYRPIDLSTRQGFFDEHRQARAQNEAWVTDAYQVARRFTGGNSDEEAGTTAQVSYLRNEPEQVELTLVYDALQDDSVEAIMYLLSLEKQDGAWEVAWAGERYRCRRSANPLPEVPRAWQTELCP